MGPEATQASPRRSRPIGGGCCHGRLSLATPLGSRIAFPRAPPYVDFTFTDGGTGADIGAGTDAGAGAGAGAGADAGTASSVKVRACVC